MSSLIFITSSLIFITELDYVINDHDHIQPDLDCVVNDLDYVTIYYAIAVITDFDITVLISVIRMFNLNMTLNGQVFSNHEPH